MSTKTSQLQIRITPEQKQALKRLAADAGLSVSKYVLATVLPSAQLEFGRRVKALHTHPQRMVALGELRSFLADLGLGEVREAIADVDLEGLAPVLQNYAAATVEQVVKDRDLPLPSWVTRVDPLDRPHFAWPARSLWPHLMRIAPLTFKRRNVFIDAAGRGAGGGP